MWEGWNGFGWFRVGGVGVDERVVNGIERNFDWNICRSWSFFADGVAFRSI